MQVQGELFGPSDKSQSQQRGVDLVIKVGGARQLSRQQQIFNRLTRQIERLRKAIEDKRAELEQALAFCINELRPLEARTIQQRKDRVKLLFPFLQRKHPRGRSFKRPLREVIAEELHTIIMHEGTLDADLDKAFKAIAGKSFKQARREEVRKEFERIESMYDRMGVAVDLSWFDPDMTDEEIAREFARMAEKADEAASREPEPPDPSPPGREGRRASKRALDREAKEKAEEEQRIRDINRLYKQLAKLFHPDLEQEPSRRQEKENAMKLLTTAHRNGDLHTMLKLEMEWTTREQADLDRLTDEKLAVYNRVLKEQVDELIREKTDLERHPRYEEILRLEYLFTDSVIVGGKRMKQKLKIAERELEISNRKLQSENAEQEMFNIVEQYMMTVF